MSKQVRVGLVGTSWWADLLYLPSLQHHSHTQLAAICGRNRARAHEMATKYQIPQVFTDYRTMIEQGQLDALIVATPDDLHYPITLAALDAGLHVLCEKPLAYNAEQARVMVEKAEAAKVKHMVFFTNRWLPHVQYVQKLIAEGHIGRCFHAEFRYFAGYDRTPHYKWRFDPQRAHGILGDLGSHMIDLARLYVGEIARVSAHLQTYATYVDPNGQPMPGANDAALLAVEFANGAQGVIHISAVAQMAGRGMQQQIALHGEAGVIEIGPENDVTVRAARAGEEQLQTLPIPDAYWGEIDRAQPYLAQLLELFATQPIGARQFIDSILADQSVSPNFHDGFKTQQVIEAALEAQRRGCWVDVPV